MKRNPPLVPSTSKQAKIPKNGRRGTDTHAVPSRNTKDRGLARNDGTGMEKRGYAPAPVSTKELKTVNPAKIRGGALGKIGDLRGSVGRKGR